MQAIGPKTVGPPLFPRYDCAVQPRQWPNQGYPRPEELAQEKTSCADESPAP
jgi:hypothetical protein